MKNQTGKLPSKIRVQLEAKKDQVKNECPSGIEGC